MSRAPRLSIGLPVYNGQTYLSESLDALLGQSYRDFELIISDNASTDRTEEICRRYAAIDSRIRYIRQPRNIGAAPNHNLVFRQARAELFKWASHDDLYGRDLLARCVEALDQHPDAVLSHAHMAIINGAGTITQQYDYALATNSPDAPERFRSLLFSDGGDDLYGVMRADVLRRVAPHGSYHNAGRKLAAELGLHGPFHQVPELLYFRRDHPGRGDRLPTIRALCANLDPRRADQTTARLLAEYVWGYAMAIVRAPLSAAQRRRCYRYLLQWLVSSTLRRAASRSASPARQRPATRGPRVGFFGILGSGNLGNDGSLDAVIAFLSNRHPDAELGFLCTGPEQVTARYGAPAVPMQWYEVHAGTATGARKALLVAVGKLLDAFRTLAWARRHDVVIVPGMGVLEASIPLRPWAFPGALLWLCAAGRLVGTKVALVSVGAEIVRNRATRRVITLAARLAHYRSYRDAASRDAMREMGVDVAADEVYSDLAFALPAPPATPATTGAVGVGVMAYFGGDGDRGRGGEIHRSYVETMQRFVRWLVDGGRQVRLLIGDQADRSVVTEILADLREHRPGLDAARVVAEPVGTLQELMRQLATVDTVVATRYHNVLCALALSKPTVAISYAAKSGSLMAATGLGEFCQPARSVDFELLVEQFSTLESRREQLVDAISEHNRDNRRHVEQQFAALSAAVLGAPEPAAEPIASAAPVAS